MLCYVIQEGGSFSNVVVYVCMSVQAPMIKHMEYPIRWHKLSKAKELSSNGIKWISDFMSST